MWGRHVYLSLGGAVVLILVAAGCGGGSSATVTGANGPTGASGPSGSTAMTKAALIKQADAICAEASTAIAALGTGTTASDRSTQVAQQLEIVRSELQSLQALKAPSQDRSTFTDLHTALKNDIVALTREL